MINIYYLLNNIFLYLGLGFDKNKNVKLLFKEAGKNDKDGDGE